MAKRKIETETKTKTEEPKFIIDKAGAAEAMKLVGKPLKAVNEAFDKMAASPSAGKLQRFLCGYFFAYGLAMKKDASLDKANAEEVKKRYVERFDTFAAVHWSDTSVGTLKGYRSYYAAFYEASFAKGDMKPAVTACLEIANVQLTWRAGRIRELIAESAKGRVTASTIAETLEPGEADQTQKGGEARFKALVNLAVNTAANPEFITWLSKQAKLMAVIKPALQVFIDYQAEAAGKMTAGAAKTTTLKAVGSATAHLAALASVRGKRPNVTVAGNA